MNINFKVYKLKEESKLWQVIKKFNTNNAFIIIGEEIMDGTETLQAHQLDENDDLVLVGDMKLNEIAMNIMKDDLIPTNTYVEYDILKSRLTLDIIENLQKYNE